MAAALLPALAVALGLGGAPAAGALVVGVLSVYILDLLGAKEGAVVALWLALGVTNLAVLAETLGGGSSPLPGGAARGARARFAAAALRLLSAAAHGLLFFLLAAWGTLQFRWVHRLHPGACVVFERLLLGGAPVVAAAVLGGGLTAAVGAAQAPFYMMAWTSGLNILFGRPKTSAFAWAAAGPSRGGGGGRGGPRRAQGGRRNPEALACGRPEAALQALALVALPAVFYAAGHLGQLLGSWGHLWRLLILAGVPALLLALLPDGEGLWWAGLPEEQLRAVRVVLMLVSAAAVVAGLEGCVLFGAFQQYVKLPPPWSYMAATLALYGAAAVAGALFMSQIEGGGDFLLDPTIMGVVLVGSATGAALVLGFPLAVVPAPMVAASGLALFIDSWALRDYLLFVLGGLVSAAWFVAHNFWFLDVHIGAVSLRLVCVAVLVGGTLCALLPGLALAGWPPSGLGGALCLLEAILLCALEEHLYAASSEDTDGFYPPYLVLFTSALGLLLARGLWRSGFVGARVTWALQCLFVSKLSMLLIPEARLFFPTLAVTMATSPAVALYHGRGGRRLRMSHAQAAGHALAVLAACIYARFAAFDVLVLITWHRPSEGLLVGVLLGGAAVGCAPLAWAHLPHSPRAKKAVLALGLAAAVLALVQPPFPVVGGAYCPRLPFRLCPRLWDEGHVPEHEQDDVDIYGEVLGPRSHWAKWLLVAAAVSGVGGLSSRPAREGLASRLTLSACAGGCVGLFAALELFPAQPALQLVVAGATVLTTVFMVFLYVPSRKGLGFVPPLFWGLVALLPISLALQAALPPPVSAEADRYFPDVARDLKDEERAALLLCFACAFLLIAFTVKVKVALPARAPQGLPAGRPGPKAGSVLSAIRRPAHMAQHVAPALLARSAASAYPAWVPAAGNTAVLLGFALSLFLSLQLSDVPDLPIFLLAPVLLLLNSDSHFFRLFSHRQRYTPVHAAVAGYLILSSLVRILGHLLPVVSDGMVYVLEPTAWNVAKNLLALALTLPNHILFSRFLWLRAHRGGNALLLATPLNAPALLLTNVRGVRLLAAGGLLAAAAHYFVGQHVKRAGERIL